MVLGKNPPRKNRPRRIGRWKNGSRKNVLQKLFSIKRMLGSLNDFFIFIDGFPFIHKKTFDVHLTILHAPNCTPLKKSRKVCCRVLGFHRLITSEPSTHIHYGARRSPHDFLFRSLGIVSEFWVRLRVLGLLSSFGFL